MRDAPSGSRRKPDLSLSLAQYKRRASVYDAELVPFEPIRAEAVRRLRLAAGDRVLDVGCGTGLSFGPIESAVRRQGRITGVEPSPEMIAIARERVRRNRWDNVDLLQQPAASAPLHGRADAALFHFTHDVLRDDESLAHVLRHLRPGAHVVATGLQWAAPWMWPTNAFVLLAALHSVTLMEGLARPWDKLAQCLDDVKVDTAMLGGVYVLSGRVKTARGVRA